MENNEMMNSERIWIAWETQRRSVQLAEMLNCKLYIIEHEGWLRYPKSILQSIRAIRESGCKILFVQNPSMVLAAFACIFKLLFGIKVIVDRHTTFRLDISNKFTVSYMLYYVLNNFTLKIADVTIVTNEFLAEIVLSFTGRPFILPDKVPDLKLTHQVKLSGQTNIMLIASYAEDEPIKNVLKAVELIPECQFTLYVTGNHKKLDSKFKDRAPLNVIFTGFLKDSDYVDMLFSVDVVLVLTTANHCMLCGCYEAVAVCKPIITSRKLVLEEYFKGSIFVDNSEEDIARGIKEMLANLDIYNEQAIKLNKILVASWSDKHMSLVNTINSIT